MSLFESLVSFFSTDAYAEEREQDDNEEQSGDNEGEGEGEEKQSGDGGDEGEQEEGEGEGEEGGDDDDEDDDDDDDEDEDEDEDEPEDIMPKLQEECSQTAACSKAKYEFQDCEERVKQWNEEEDESKKGPKEDCVEEFFEYQHCITQCAAPKLFKQLA